MAPTIAEYWLKATKRIMNDLDCTMVQKLRGAVLLLKDEAYQWWLTVEQSSTPEMVTWEAFKRAFQVNMLRLVISKLVGVNL